MCALTLVHASKSRGIVPQLEECRAYSVLQRFNGALLVKVIG